MVLYKNAINLCVYAVNLSDILMGPDHPSFDDSAMDDEMCRAGQSLDNFAFASKIIVHC
jgi:hypothetical protein